MFDSTPEGKAERRQHFEQLEASGFTRLPLPPADFLRGSFSRAKKYLADLEAALGPENVGLVMGPNLVARIRGGASTDERDDVLAETAA